MKRIVCLIAVLMMCATLSYPAFAAENDFVPSITYKDGPDIETAIQGDKDNLSEGEEVSDCVVITSIADAENKSTDIYQEARDLLLDVYKKLSNGSMKLPLEDGYVIRELVDVSHKRTDCVETDHTHDADLKKDGIVISVKFDLGIGRNTDVKVLSYHGGQWDPAISVKNNGDGTVTCILEHFCPVAFCVDGDVEILPPQTGDNAGGSLILWSSLLVVSMCAVVGLVIVRRKTAR